MAKKMLIDALHPEETRVVIAHDNKIVDYDFVSSSKKQVKGNIYLAKITRVEPSLQAAFVEYGSGRQGFLPFSEIHPDYYQIPTSDRKRLMEEVSQSSDDDTVSDGADTSHQPPYDQDGAATTEAEVTQLTDVSEMDAALAPLPLAPAIEELPETEFSPDDDRPVFAAESSGSNVLATEAAPQPDDLAASDDVQPTEHGQEPSDINPYNDAPAAESGAESSGESVETIPNDEEEIQSRRTKNRFSRRYKIQEVIRRGQVVLIQVIKEERGNKGASLTTYLSLAGRYCVLMPNSPKDGGISRKIASADDRKRLKAISTELKLAQGMSVIIRTAGMDRTRAEIKRDYDYLVKLWNRIREDTLRSNAPALIYEESDVIKRAIRDQYTNDIDELVIEGREGFETARDFMKLLLPSHTPKIKLHQESMPLFYAHNIEDQLLSMHDEVVKLRSGGYIVINPTEALISIDVNSGRATGERNIEETATKTNLEAAAEVARQLRLRDLAGLIVIDFIDMMESRNRRAVEKALKDALKMDRAKIQLGRISPFGLLEMSRQRLRPSISETNMVQCPHCSGRGYIRSNESLSIQMIRALEKEAASGNWSGIRLIAPQQVALHLLNTKRENLRSIEERHQVTIQVLIDTELASSEYNLEKMRRSGSDRQSGNDRRGRGRERDRDRDRPREQENTPVQADTILEEMSLEPQEESGDDQEPMFPSETSENDSGSGSEFRPGGRRSRGRGRNRRGGRGRRDRTDSPASEQPQDRIMSDSQSADAPAMGATEGEPQPNQRSGRRDGRGRRRWRDRGGREQTNQHSAATSYSSTSDATNDNLQSEPTRLPAFATQEAASVQTAFATPSVQPMISAPMEPPPPANPRDPSAPAKKGWWQKMIQLDD
ncbi:MAG: Rne/Rng family ribonuclease [Alphaproteobacteria bacterium]|nr:Rne/Rng family ribonuclease [Alphaproteobacteria bacterium]